MPRLHDNIEARLTRELIIDPEFKELIPPLTAEEYSGLEQSIIAEGCREPIITWDNIIIDGHNRYRICKAHHLPYKTTSKEFASRDEAKLWMLKNQLSRRNLNDFQRIEIARKYEEAVKLRAEQRMLAGKSDHSVIGHKGRATEELGKMAGVSASTYIHATAVLDKAPTAIIEAARQKEISINAAYEVTKMEPEHQEEISERIESGERAEKVISDVKERRKDRKVKNGLDYWNTVVRNAKKAVKDGRDIDDIIKLVSEALKILKNSVTA